MNIIIQCQDCGKHLVVSETFIPMPLDNIVAKVKPCGCAPGAGEDTDKSICENCEDLKLWQTRAEEAEAKLKYLKELLNENKPTQPEEEEPEVNTLKPTEDITSTGGAIVPGIKKGSAKGVKANY